MKFIQSLCIAGVLSGTVAQASSIDDLDLASIVFDIQTETVTGPNEGSYTGISGLTGTTVGFSILAYDPLTDTSSTQAFAFPATTGLGSPEFEHAHVGRQFTINFDSEISRLLIYAENGGTALLTGVDLDFAPSDFGGATIANGATAYTVNTSNTASFFLYEFTTPTTSVVNVFSGGTNDGFDMAFFAEPAAVPVPVPAGLPLVLTGLGVLALLRRQA